MRYLMVVIILFSMFVGNVVSCQTVDKTALKVEEYTVISYSGYDGCEVLKSVSENIQKMINEGWKPLGGISVAISKHSIHTYYFISQAMVR